MVYISDLPYELLVNIISYLPSHVSDKSINWYRNKLILRHLFIFAKTSKKLCKTVKDYSVYLIYNHRYSLHINDVFSILKLISFVDNKIVLLNDIGSIGFRKNRLIKFTFDELQNYMNEHVNKICYDDDDIIVSYGCYEERLSKYNCNNLFYFGWGMRFIFDPEDEELYEKMYIIGMSKDEIFELEMMLLKRRDFTKITVLRPIILGQGLQL